MKKPKALRMGPRDARAIDADAFAPEGEGDRPEMELGLYPGYAEWTPVRARKLARWLMEWAKWAEREGKRDE